MLWIQDGYTPMAVAVQQGHKEVVDILTEFSQKGKTRLSALHVAAKKNDVHAASMLLQSERNVCACFKYVNCRNF